MIGANLGITAILAVLSVATLRTDGSDTTPCHTTHNDSHTIDSDTEDSAPTTDEWVMPTAPTEFDLSRFVKAQNSGGVYAQAVAELRSGRKVTHWMWFVFPQLAGLGRSSTARLYAIASLDEARAYLAHDVLGPRLIECSRIVAGHVSHSATDLFGSVDALKLHSSMTLFSRADPDQEVFATVLALFFSGVPDAATDKLLE